MGRVVSLGSVNVDRYHEVTVRELDALADRHAWFPERGETVAVDDLPADFGGEPDAVRHGGKGANQAVAAARAGADAAFCGLVGADAEERGVLDALERHGVETDLVGVADVPTGTADVFVGPEGDNRIVVRPGANGALDGGFLADRTDAVVAADCLLLQNEVPVEPVGGLLARLAEAAESPTVILDPAPPEGAEALLVHPPVDLVTPNEAEYEALASHLADFAGTVVRKRGGDDVLVEGEERFAVTPPSVSVEDTTGAGDAFNGVLAARLAAGDRLHRAVEVATVAGSLATREAGARRGIPTLEAVLAFEAGRDEGRTE